MISAVKEFVSIHWAKKRQEVLPGCRDPTES